MLLQKIFDYGHILFADKLVLINPFVHSFVNLEEELMSNGHERGLTIDEMDIVFVFRRVNLTFP
jgi:hypothetical protein